MTAPSRPYHHGQLRQVVIDAAVEEVEAVGAANLSMRAIARRAGVSHAAPAHHFGDKAGIFTAIAVEGFRLIAETIAPATDQPDGFVHGGLTYIVFAITHPGHFEVMFRPDLYRRDDPDLIAARDAAYDVLYTSADAALDDEQKPDLAGLVVAGWSVAHGFATLLQHADLQDHVSTDPSVMIEQITRGIVALGEVTRRYLDRATD